MIEFLLIFIASLISQIVTIFAYGKINKKKLCLKELDFVLIISMSLFQALQNIYEFFIGKLISPLISIIYFIYVFQRMYKSDRKTAVSYSIIIWTISVIIDLISMLIISNTVTLNEQNRNILKFFSSLFMSLIQLIIFILPISQKYIKKINQKIVQGNIDFKHISVVIVIYLIIGVFSVSNIDNAYLISVVVVIGLISLIIIYNFVSMNYQIVMLKKTNDILEKNNEGNLELLKEYRVLKHNLEHNLMGIKSVANKKSQQLIDALIKEYNSKFYIKQDMTSMPGGINGFILEKFYKYAEEDLKITVENKIKKKILGLLGPRNYNLFCEALGVTLDNALESAVKSKEKLLYLEFKETKESLMVTVTNTFTGNIEIDKLGTKEYTSKETGHGLGLYSLFNRKNLYITTAIKNNLFINKIEVKKKH